MKGEQFSSAHCLAAESCQQCFMTDKVQGNIEPWTDFDLLVLQGGGNHLNCVN